MSNSTPWKDDAALLFVVLIWGVNFPILKAALAVMPVHVVNAFRFTLSVLVLGIIYAVRQRHRSGGFFGPVRKHGLHIAGLGLIGSLFYQLCFIIGMDHTTAGNAALIMASSPLWTALLSRVLGFESLPQKAWWGLGISFAGTALVVLAGTGAVSLNTGTLFGNLLMLGGAVLWGVYTALSKPLLARISPTSLSFFGLLTALPFLYGVAVPYFDTVVWTNVDAWVWAAIVYSGGFSTGIAYIIWNVAVKNVGPSHTAVYNNLVPFVALLGGVVLLGESVAVVQLAGGILIVGGLVVMRRSGNEQLEMSNVQ